MSRNGLKIPKFGGKLKKLAEKKLQDLSFFSCMVEITLLWKLGRTGKAGDTVGVLQWLVSNSLDRAHHLRSMLHKCCMGKGDQ